MLIKKSNVPENEYDVTIKATVVVRVKSRNAYHAIARAESELCERLSKKSIDVVDFKSVSSSSVEDK